MAIRFQCAYDGKDFHGFQRQVNAPTIQAMIEEVCRGLMGPGHIVGAGRTDSGVHAQGQVVVWYGASPIPLERLCRVLNQRLPAGIRLSHPSTVDDGWDPIRTAHQKQYSYRLWRDPECRLPWLHYSCYWPRDLNWATLVKDAGLLKGQHDFRAFRGEGSSARTTIRTISQCGWHVDEGGAIWRFEVVADGFLYHMVRMMVGAMLCDAGTDRASQVERGLAEPWGRKVAEPAPAEGLMLDRVIYSRT